MENNRVEYKRELTDSLKKRVVAFLNTPEREAIINAAVHNDYAKPKYKEQQQ